MNIRHDKFYTSLPHLPLESVINKFEFILTTPQYEGLFQVDYRNYLTSQDDKFVKLADVVNVTADTIAYKY